MVLSDVRVVARREVLVNLCLKFFVRVRVRQHAVEG